MKYYQRWLTALTLIIGLICGQSFAQTRTLKMAANYDSQPFLYVDSEGQLIGFEVDLIREIGKLKGFEVDIVPAIFPAVFEDLRNQKIDFIGHVYNDDERKMLYQLTEPHYIEKVTLLTLKDKGIQNPFSSGLTYATLAFSPLEHAFETNIVTDYPELKKKSEQTTYLGFKDLFLKDADILMTTESHVNRLIKNRGNFEYQHFEIPEQYLQKVAISFLTTKGNTDLVEDINSGLQELKDNGTYDRLKKKYQL